MNGSVPSGRLASRLSLWVEHWRRTRTKLSTGTLTERALRDRRLGCSDALGGWCATGEGREAEAAAATAPPNRPPRSRESRRLPHARAILWQRTCTAGEPESQGCDKTFLCWKSHYAESWNWIQLHFSLSFVWNSLGTESLQLALNNEAVCSASKLNLLFIRIEPEWSINSIAN